MKKNILKESAQETVANCSANDLKRILGGEPTRNEEGELDYFTENSINPRLRKAHPDLFSDIKYLRIFPKADKNTYYDEQGQGDPDDNKWAWLINVTTLNDTTSNNTRAVVRIKDFIEGSIGNQINEVKKLQKIAGIIKESIYEQGEDESVQGLISQLKNKKYNTNLLFNADDIESQIYSDYDGEVSEEKVIEILNSIDTEPVWEVLTQQIDKAIQEKLPS